MFSSEKQIKLYPKPVTHKVSWIALLHPDLCHICIFSQMAKNLRSPPNLFCVIWTKLHKTELGGIASFYLQQRLMLRISYLQRNCSTAFVQHYLRLKFAIMELLNSTRLWRNQRAKSYHIIIMITTRTLSP